VDEPGGTLVLRAARQLTALSLQHEEGAFIGAEDDLRALLGVSRPTLRQAAKIAESEKMISVRRGTRGGFYATRPDVRDAVQTLNRYLRLQGAEMKHVSVAASIIEEAAELASQCDDESLSASLAAMLVEVDRCDGAHEMADLDTRFLQLLGKMSGNPFAELVIGIMCSFGWSERGLVVYQHEWQRTEAKRELHAVGEAILAQDGELARFSMRRRQRAIRSWMTKRNEPELRPVAESAASNI